MAWEPPADAVLQETAATTWTPPADAVAVDEIDPRAVDRLVARVNVKQSPEWWADRRREAVLADADPLAKAPALISEPYRAVASAGLSIGSTVARPFSKDAADRLLKEKENIAQVGEAARKDDWSPWLSRIYGGAVESLAQSGIAAATGTGAAGIIGSFALTEGNQALYDAEQAGLKGADRIKYAVVQGAIEGTIAGVFQRFAPGLEKFVPQIAGGALKLSGKQFLKMTAQELPEELLTELGHAVAESASGVDAGATSAEQLVPRMIDTVAQTLATLGLAQGTARLAQNRQRLEQLETLRTTDSRDLKREAAKLGIEGSRSQIRQKAREESKQIQKEIKRAQEAQPEQPPPLEKRTWEQTGQGEAKDIPAPVDESRVEEIINERFAGRTEHKAQDAIKEERARAQAEREATTVTQPVPTAEAPPIDVEARVAEIFKDKWGGRPDKGTKRDAIREEMVRQQVAEEEEVQRKYPPGTTLKVKGLNLGDGRKPQILYVEPDGKLLQIATRRHGKYRAGEQLRYYKPEDITVLSREEAIAEARGDEWMLKKYEADAVSRQTPTQAVAPPAPTAPEVAATPPPIPSTAAQPEAPRAKFSWQMSRDEFQQTFGTMTKRKKIVKDAVSAGKPVPPEVLADFPELTAKATSKKSYKKAQEAKPDDIQGILARYDDDPSTTALDAIQEIAGATEDSRIKAIAERALDDVEEDRREFGERGDSGESVEKALEEIRAIASKPLTQPQPAPEAIQTPEAVQQPEATSEAAPVAKTPKSKGRKPKKPSEPQTLMQAVQQYGGISAKAIKRDVNIYEDFKEFGILGAFKNADKGKGAVHDLETMAIELEGAGIWRAPEGANKGDALLQALKAKAKTIQGMEKSDSEYDKEYAEYQNQLEQEKRDAQEHGEEVDSFREDLRAGAKDGLSEAQATEGEAAEVLGEVDLSFDFGANVKQGVPGEQQELFQKESQGSLFNVSRRPATKAEKGAPQRSELEKIEDELKAGKRESLPGQQTLLGEDEGEGIASFRSSPNPTRQARSSKRKTEGEKPGIAAADIQKTAERIFNVPIRQGGFSTRRAAGIYKWLSGRSRPPSPDVVRTKEEYYASLGVVAHEVAHHLDETTKAVRGMPADVKKEIKRLDYEPQKGRAFEGWAEFLRRYMTEPAIDANGKQVPNPGIDAPKTLAWFEGTYLPAHPDVAKAVAEFRGYAQEWAQQSVFQRLGSMISDRQPKDLSFKEEWLRKSRQKVNRLKTDFVDKFHTLEWIQKEAKRRGHKGIGIYDLTMAHFLSASSHATIAFEEGVKSLQTGKPIGKTSLWGLRDHLESDGEYQDAVLYAAARHTLFMAEKKPGYATAFDIEDAENWLGEVEESGRTERFEAFAQGLAEFNNDLLKMLVEAGALPQDQADNMLRYYGGKNYFPLHRVRDGDQGRFAGTGVGFVNLGKPVKGRSAKGSGRQIIDPIDATVAQAMRFYGRAIQARQQHVLAETLDPKLGGVGGMGGLMDRVDPRRKVTRGQIKEILGTLVEEGIVLEDDAKAMRVASQILHAEEGIPSDKSLDVFAKRHGLTPDKDGVYDAEDLVRAANQEPDPLAVISLWRPDYTPNAAKRTVIIYDKQGKPLMYEMDPDLYATATGMDEIQFGPFISVFREAARWFKTGAVGASTGFGAANLLRDYWEFQGKAQHVKGLSSLGKPPAMLGRYVAEKARKLAGHDASDPLIRLYEESGGKVYSIIGHDADSRQRYRRRRMGKSTMSKLGIALERPGDSAESVLQGMMDLIAVSDAPPRLADAEAAIREEGFEIRDGSWFDVSNDKAVDQLPEHVRIKAAVAMAEATINFKRVGAKGQYIEAFLPFFNASVQAQYRQYQQLKSLKGVGKKDVDGMRARRYMVYLSALAATGVAFWLLRHDDDDWREQDAYLRDGYWTWGKDGKTYLRIPKPRDAGIVANLVENMLDAWYHNDARDTSDVVLRDFGSRLPTGGGFIRGAIEAFVADYDYFREKELTPDYLKDLPKEQQSTPYTSRASDAIGQVTGRYLGISPIQVEHLLNSASGGFYHRMNELYDASIDNRLGPEHIPFLRGLVIDRHQARSISDFYRQRDEARIAVQREKVDNGKVSDETTGKQAVLDGHAELMTSIRELEGKVGKKRDYKYQPYLVGLARAALGYDELPDNPNPITDKHAPEEIQKIVRDYSRRAVKAAKSPMKPKSEYKDEEAYEEARRSRVRAKAKVAALKELSSE